MTPRVPARVSLLRDSLVELGRLAALRVLAEPETVGRKSAARQAVLRLQQARQLDELARRHLGVPERPVSWASPPSERGFADEAPLLATRVREVQEGVEGALAHALEGVRAGLAAAGCEPLLALLDELRGTLSAPAPRLAPQASAARELHSPHVAPEDFARPAGEPQASEARPRGIARVFRGPRHIAYPPELAGGFAAADREEPRACHSPERAAPFFWCLSAREGMAALACCLSVVEYDGLPLDFYLDLSRQAWDETRHAELFLTAARRWIPTLLTHAAPGDFWAAAGRAHLEQGTPLPVPRERALYAGTWLSSLEDRLGFLQVDDEGAAVHVFREMLDGPLCAQDAALVPVVAGVAAEEASHARLGHAWLRHLIPNEQQRTRHLLTVQQSRGALTIAAVLHDRGLTAAELFGGDRARRA